MSYRTILVHLNDERRAERVLRPAIALARNHHAELVGLHVVPGAAALTAMVVPYGAEIAGSVVESDRRIGKAIEAVFRRETEGQPFAARWLEIETMEADLCSVVLQHARAADLIVAAQADLEWGLSDLVDFPERLALESGRPVLVLPNGGGEGAPGRHVLVAWNGTREATRAAFDSLPFLTGADVVDVVTIADGETRGGPAAETLAGAMARHGVAARFEHLGAGGRDVADAIMARAEEIGADLVVMGAYGHSRWREYVFGGVTRAVARRMTLPILLSH